MNKDIDVTVMSCLVYGLLNRRRVPGVGRKSSGARKVHQGALIALPVNYAVIWTMSVTSPYTLSPRLYPRPRLHPKAGFMLFKLHAEQYHKTLSKYMRIYEQFPLIHPYILTTMYKSAQGQREDEKN